jgi:protein-L-isoaspartate(D-aspartate) O-methyltransferase
MEKLDQLINEVISEVRDTAAMIGRAVLDERVVAALRAVPRHEFVPVAELPFAYENEALPIGHGQTISQPYIVALMTDLLELDAQANVLEIGTGSGYQSAILCQLARRVYSMEINPELAAEARERLQRLDCRNIEFRVGDGREGWPEHAPYDAIVVTAACEGVPPRLLEQLKPGGRMVLPVNGTGFRQELTLVTKDDTGHIHIRGILPVSFVPLTAGVVSSEL